MRDTVIPAVVMAVVWIGGPLLILRVQDRLRKKKRPVFGCLASGTLTFVVVLVFGCFMVWYPADVDIRLLAFFPMFSVPIIVTGAVIRRVSAPGPALETVEVPAGSPEMVAASKQVHATLGWFTQQIENKVPGKGFMKFQRVIAGSVKEPVWALVEGYQNGLFKVAFPTLYDAEEPVSRAEIDETLVEDWQFLRPDGKLKGGFTLIGTVRYLERKGRKLNETMRKQKQALLDFNRPGGL